MSVSREQFGQKDLGPLAAAQGRDVGIEAEAVRPRARAVSSILASMVEIVAVLDIGLQLAHFLQSGPSLVSSIRLIRSSR
jgi:hypothetical protein